MRGHRVQLMRRAIVGFCAVAIMGCGEPRKLMPEAFAGLTRTGALSPSEARIAVNQLHGKSVTPAENAVASFAGETGTATLYGSRYGSSEEAGEATDAMVAGLRKGNHPLGMYHELEAGGRKIHACLGTAQAHYAFVLEERVYWLAVDSAIGSTAIAALVDSLKI